MADAGENSILCDGLSIVIGGSTSGGVQPYNYEWVPTTGLDSTNVAYPVASSTVNTTYFLTVTDSNGCVGKDTIEITIVSNPSAYAGNDTTVCSGSAVQLGATPIATGGLSPYNYLWFPESGLDSSIISHPICSTWSTAIYYLTVFDSNGCRSDDL